MFDEEDIKKPVQDGINRNLEPMSVDELKIYISDLKAEIARVKADIKQKEDVFNAANSVFKT